MVSNAAASGAIRDVYDETRTVLEAAGALSVAGARAYLKRNNIQARPAPPGTPPPLPAACCPRRRPPPAPIHKMHSSDAHLVSLATSG